MFGNAILPGGWPGLPFFLHFLAAPGCDGAPAGAGNCRWRNGLRTRAEANSRAGAGFGAGSPVDASGYS